MMCEYCSFKCIASDCECLCHDKDRLIGYIVDYCKKANVKGSFNNPFDDKLVSFELKEKEE